MAAPATDANGTPLTVPRSHAPLAHASEPDLHPAPPGHVLPPPWPQIASVVPGALVHGAGTWLEGRSRTTGRLLLLEGAGLAATFTSGLILFRTGAARDVVGPAALLAVFGVGTFAASFLANVYATAAPRAGWGQPRRVLPLVESRVGYLYASDPHFDYRHFLSTSVEAQLGAVRLGGASLFAPAQDNQRVSFSLGYRAWGVTGRGIDAAPDGSYLELSSGYAEHHFDGEGFLSRQIEVSLTGRLDSQRYLPDVGGAFFQYQAGYARQWFDFDLPGVSSVTPNGMLLARVGFGAYLGNRGDATLGPTGGELEVYYDHRHDGLAGGLKTRRIGNGPVGHVGLLGSYQLTPRWGVAANAQVGSAIVAGLSLVVRAGVR